MEGEGMKVYMIFFRYVKLHRNLFVLEEAALDKLHLCPDRASAFARYRNMVPIPVRRSNDPEGNLFVEWGFIDEEATILISHRILLRYAYPLKIGRWCPNPVRRFKEFTFEHFHCHSPQKYTY